jgi:hypothetical protein
MRVFVVVICGYSKIVPGEMGAQDNAVAVRLYEILEVIYCEAVKACHELTPLLNKNRLVFCGFVKSAAIFINVEFWYLYLSIR